MNFDKAGGLTNPKNNSFRCYIDTTRRLANLTNLLEQKIVYIDLYSDTVVFSLQRKIKTTSSKPFKKTENTKLKYLGLVWLLSAVARLQ